MHHHPQLPATVRFNRGLGWSFWLVTGIMFFLCVVMFLASFSGRFPWWLPGSVFAAWIVVVFILRAIQGPRAVIDFANGTVLTRSGAHPFFEVTSFRVRDNIKAGEWLNIGVGDRYVTRLHISADCSERQMSGSGWQCGTFWR